MPNGMSHFFLLKVSSRLSTKLELWVIPYNFEIINYHFQYSNISVPKLYFVESKYITWLTVNRGRLPIDQHWFGTGEGSYYGARQNVGQTWSFFTILCYIVPTIN